VELICTTEQTDTTDKMVYKPMSLQPGSNVLNRRSTEAQTSGTHLAINLRELSSENLGSIVFNTVRLTLK
jgi:hypothetical protein